MRIELNELQMYENFEDLASDILDMAKEVIPDKLIYLTTFTENQQVILKLSEASRKIHLSEGMKIDLNDTVCNRIDFKRNLPLVFEDMNRETSLDDLRKTLSEANIKSYLGVPILLSNGEAFGTLCSAHFETSHFDQKSIKLLQKIAKLFSYYLELERLAYRDYLTDLYNRQYLYKYFDRFPMDRGALFFLDLDGFKKINDNNGHDFGDTVLKEVAQALLNFIKGKKGFAVRLGGDEFIISLTDLPSIKAVKEMADTLLSGISAASSKFTLSTSIGIVPVSEGQKMNLEGLLKEADEALYQAKANGKNTYCLHE